MAPRFTSSTPPVVSATTSSIADATELLPATSFCIGSPMRCYDEPKTSLAPLPVGVHRRSYDHRILLSDQTLAIIYTTWLMYNDVVIVTRLQHCPAACMPTWPWPSHFQQRGLHQSYALCPITIQTHVTNGATLPLSIPNTSCSLVKDGPYQDQQLPAEPQRRPTSAAQHIQLLYIKSARDPSEEA